jgi:hypothetical protein
MSRARIESLLTSFPKLIPTNTQHTSVETAEVRYVYQPLEELYIILITNKASNILQDIETLHLIARVVSDMCRNAEEREILKNAFDLLGAFDEIVSLGYREQVSLAQVRSVLEMESHEEKIQEIIARVSTLDFLRKGTKNKPSPHHRTKKLRPRKSSSGGPNNSRCNDVSSNGARLRVWEVEVEVEATWAAVRLVIPRYPSGSRLPPLSGQSLPNLRLSAPPLSRAAE